MKLEKISSYVIHPVVFGTITTLSYFIILPTFLPSDLKWNIISIVFVSTYLIPIIFLFLLKSFKTIGSFHLEDANERKFPVFFFIILNFVLYSRLIEIPKLELLSLFFLSSSVSLVFVYVFLFFNIKISLHTLALGLYTTFLMLISYHFKIRLIILISAVLLISGFIAMARLKLKAHNTAEVYTGFFLGVIVEILLYLLLT